MKYCRNCGAQMQDQEMFCSRCGTQQTQRPFPDGYMTYPDQGVARPVLKNSYTAIIGYLSWLGFLIAMVGGDRRDRYARLHLNQALGIHIAYTIGVFLQAIGAGILGIGAALDSFSYYFYDSGRLVAGSIFVLIAAVILIFAFVCWLIGIIRACKGRTKPVALFGAIRLLK